MAARREHGAPSALTVLEVAEGLRWSDPALGASLAEHVRRLAGDDATVRAAADRSVIRSLAESDRHDDVVERGIPLLTEARSRGDREDGAAVLVELAAAARALGDPGLARRLLDRLGPVHDLPARIGAAACAVRAEAYAANGDVAGTDAAGDGATTMLLRVGQPESAVVRARIELARGIARRRAGDLEEALAVFTSAISGDPPGDVDGGRRSLAAAAELTELLVEAGRSDEARNRVRAVLPDGTPGPQVAVAVGRIRLALAAGSDDGGAAATTSAEELEAVGRSADAARAWELVATLAEASGDLGRALVALRRGHALGAAARGSGDRALRALAAVAEGADLLATPTVPDGPDASDDARNPDGAGDAAGMPGRRRGRRDGPAVDRTVPPRPVTPAPEWGGGEPGGALTAGPATPTPPSTEVAPPPPLTTWPSADEPVGPTAVVEFHASPAATDRSEGAGEVPGAATSGPTSTPSEAVQRSSEEPTGAAPRSSTRDELAELLASLTRSVDSSRAAASAMGLEPAPPTAMSEATPASADRDAMPPSMSFAFDAQPTTHTRASSNVEPSAEPSATRPTFDAFSTAPRQDDATRAEDETPTPVAPLPDDRFAPADDGRAPDRSTEVAPGSSDRSDRAEEPDDLLAGFLGRTTANGRGPDVGVAADTATTPSSDDGGRALEAGPGAGSPRPAPSPRSATATPNGTTSPRSESRRAESDDLGSTEPGAGGRSRRDDPTAGSTSAHTDGARKSTHADTGRRTRTDAATDDGANGVNSADGVVRRVSADHRTRGESGGNSDVRPERRGESERPRPGRDAGPRSEQPRPEPRGRTHAPTPDRASDRPVDEYDEELALTLATVLGEYHLPDVPMPPRRDGRGTAPADPTGGGAAGGVSVPSARRHTSGSMPVPGEPRRAAGSDSPVDPASSAPGLPGRNGSASGRGRPPESGARLADLLAEAMDAFRHVGPEPQDGARGPGVGSRRA